MGLLGLRVAREMVTHPPSHASPIQGPRHVEPTSGGHPKFDEDYPDLLLPSHEYDRRLTSMRAMDDG